MIINELAYKVTIKADEFLNGKRKVKEEAEDLKNEIEKSSSAIEKSTTSSMSKTTKEADKASTAMKGLTSAFNGFLGLSTRFMVVGGVMTAVAIGIHRAFESTAESIVRASNMGRMLGTNASNVLGTQYGFARIGQNGGAFLGAQMNAKMALANIEDPTIFGGMTAEAQNLLTTGARTGIDIHKLGGKSEDALAEFQKYGKGHNEKQLMQVLAAFGYDPNLAGDIKNGKAVKMVSEEEKRWKMTKEQEEAQRNILATTKALDSQFEKVKQDLMATFGPEVLKAEQEFLEWLKNNKGDIIGALNKAGTAISSFSTAVGGAGNALGILAAMALLSGKGLGSKLGVVGAVGIFGQMVQDQYKDVPDAQRPVIFQQHWIERLFDVDYDDPNKDTPTNKSGKTRADRNFNPLNLKTKGNAGKDSSGFAKYTDEESGWGAARRQLSLYYTRDKLDTISGIINKWAPPSENDTNSYVDQISKAMGMGANEKLDLSDPAIMAKLSSYMARHEGYSNWKSGLDYGNPAKNNEAGYYQTQQKLANGSANQSYAQSVVNNYNSQNIGEVKVSATTDQASKLAEGFKEMNRRSSTNQSFSSAVR
ncbi:TPA: hypothetical protein N0X70_001581 [Enterobacter roggenkampii]|uniref:hypothetical protein n=1 Tax=Enterobacter roggenkampii TaxID=1812935 RepID=UPI000385F38B|nr:hypothetical protein [Enterobacter roggenkampii]CAH5457948.1 hypothetical protein AI2941V1_0218 [Enterobacter cloacae]EPY97148.1 hypothetical protein L799_09055 [Enterobacter roggenkampii EC_38VIM1]KTK00413.1 hypothetical protein ASU70_07365 [Enterobacter roggenkampii]HCK7123752.1 hypothetical protein [Enterobacter roggenkampii]HCK7190753.1 hypothetical protein [Enterobacter roggenkampii]